jgi:bifunctional oligoribonuclease and PAP phosphatase NrnA
MADNELFQRAVELIDQAGTILITTHTKPDGDACGCVAAMTEVLRARGKTVRPLFLSRMPLWYTFLFDEKVPVLRDDLQVSDLTDGAFGQVDLIVIVDTDSYSQLPHFDAYLKRKTDIPILVIDHHVTSDKLGRVEIVDAKSPATGLVVYDFLTWTGWPLSERIAEALFVATATDTGWFQYTNTDSRTFRRAAELVDLGVNPAVTYDKLYQNFSYSRFKLMRAMLNRLELYEDGRFAILVILQEDFQQTDSSPEDTENFINECHRIESVKVSALLVELKDGRIRCSLRSRGRVDVSEVAARFGGGGHKNAAGTFLPGPISHARHLIHDAIAPKLAAE